MTSRDREPPRPGDEAVSKDMSGEDVPKDMSDAGAEAAPKDRPGVSSEDVPKDRPGISSEDAPKVIPQSAPSDADPTAATDEDVLQDMPLWAAEETMPAAAVADAFTALSLALPPARPASDLRARLLAAAAAPERRFSPFIARLARLIDVAHERARELLAGLARPEVWQAVLPSVELVHLDGGPAVAGADVGFVRVAAGATFPHHRHLGDEHVLVLQGGFVEDDGTVTRAGASTFRPAGSAHSLTALPDQDLVYAVVVYGVAFDTPLALE